MRSDDRIETIETWLGAGPVAAPERLMAGLPARLSATRQAGAFSIRRMALFLAPVAAGAVILAALIWSGMLAPPVGDDEPTPIPSPPTPIPAGGRVNVVLLIENRSDTTYGSWQRERGSSGSKSTTHPCSATIGMHRMWAPGVVRFGDMSSVPTGRPYPRESLPVILDTNALPGRPVAFKDQIPPLWTYAYRVTVGEGKVVTVEPLDAVPSSASAGPLCPVLDTSWPGGWPDVQAWLAERPALADCGVERWEFLAWEVRPRPLGDETVPNTAARRCLYGAWLTGGGGQFVRLVFTNDGPAIEVLRASGGNVESLFQHFYSGSPGFYVTTCSRLVPPSELDAVQSGPDDDATMVFAVDRASCSPAADLLPVGGD